MKARSIAWNFNRGGVVQSWKLKKYFDDQKPPQPLDLVNDSVAQQLGWPFSLVLSDPQLEAQGEFGALRDRDPHSARRVTYDGQPAE